MHDMFARLRRKAIEKEQKKQGETEPPPQITENPHFKALAKRLGTTYEEVNHCCGSICPHCEVFLDKAIVLVESGQPHHLLMNPIQSEVFDEALALYRRDKVEYERQRGSLIEKIR